MDHKVEELRAGGQVTSSIPPTPGPAPVPRPCRAPQAGQPPAALHSLKAPPPPRSTLHIPWESSVPDPLSAETLQLCLSPSAANSPELAGVKVLFFGTS